MTPIFLDTEATGVDQEDRLCQLAYRAGEIEVNELFKPPLPIKIEAMAVSHITNKMVQEKPVFSSSKEKADLQSLLDDRENIFVAHNAPFDIAMLQKEGVVVPQYICTLKVARELDQEGKIPKYNLQYLRYLLDLDVPEAQAHDALGDVLVLEKLFERLLKKMLDSGSSQQEAFYKMIEISKKPSLIRRFDFGKHNGKTLADVSKEDPGYLEWLLTQKTEDDFNGVDWIYSLKYYLGRLDV